MTVHKRCRGETSIQVEPFQHPMRRPNCHHSIKQVHHSKCVATTFLLLLFVALSLFSLAQPLPARATNLVIPLGHRVHPQINLNPLTPFQDGTTALYEPFEDQDLSLQPTWEGDTGYFIHQTENEKSFLQLDAPESVDRAQISTASNIGFGTWKFSYRQDVQASNVNRAFFVLMSDRPDFNYLDGSEWNGYAIRTGENGSNKQFRLLRFDNGEPTVLLSAALPASPGLWYKITVGRSLEGEWQLTVVNQQSDETTQTETIIDLVHQQSACLGLFIRFSSSNRQAFRVDDILVENSLPFEAIAVEPQGSYSLLLRLTYPADTVSVDPSMFLLDDTTVPAEVVYGEAGSHASATSSTLNLRFDVPFSEGGHILMIQGLSSLDGELIEQQHIPFTYTNPFQITGAEFQKERFDVIFSTAPDADAVQYGQVEVNGVTISQFGPVSSSDGQDFGGNESDPIRWRFYPDSSLPAGEITVSFTNWTDQEGYILKNPVLNGWVSDEAAISDVVINEFFYRVPASWRTDAFPRPAYVELYNRSEKTLNLKNWSLNGHVFLSEADVVLLPGDYVVLTRGLSVFYPVFGPGPYMEAEAFPDLPLTTGSNLVLRTDSGLTADSLYYTASEWGGDGVSVEKTDPDTAGEDPSKWSEPTGGRLGTPGVLNSVYEKDLAPPVPVIAAYLEEETAEIRFDEHILFDVDSVPKPGVEIDGTAVPPENLALISGRRLRIHDPALQPETSRMITLRHISDVAGNTSDSPVIPLAHPAGPGDLAIHELMIQPVTDPFDGLPDQTEYIELKNRRDYALQMRGLEIRDLPDELGDERRISPTEDDDRWVPARGYFVLYPDAELLPFSESLFARAFQLDAYLEIHTAPVERSTLGLSATEQTVRLFGPGDLRMDSLRYDSNWHNPNVTDPKGRSLERMDAFADGTASWNWGTSGGLLGGTPGQMNSLAPSAPEQTDVHGVTVFPRVFSPDGDGFDDLLAIAYQLPETDYILSVQVFDERGRLVRRIADDYVAGRTGTLYWNGFDDSGIKSRAGLYIIFTEAYSRERGSSRRYKTSAAIAVRN